MDFDRTRGDSHSAMTIKDEIRRLADSLPDAEPADPSDAIEEMQHRLYVLSKVQRGLKELDAGKGVPHEDVKRRLAKWLAD